VGATLRPRIRESPYSVAWCAPRSGAWLLRRPKGPAKGPARRRESRRYTLPRCFARLFFALLVFLLLLWSGPRNATGPQMRRRLFLSLAASVVITVWRSQGTICGLFSHPEAACRRPFVFSFIYSFFLVHFLVFFCSFFSKFSRVARRIKSPYLPCKKRTEESWYRVREGMPQH